jgi:hypothetical protein
MANLCNVNHILDIRTTIFSSFITDPVLLSLMLFGVFRWKEARMMGDIWEVMYTQVGISRIAIVIQANSILVIGIDICCSRHSCGSTSCGAFSP